MQDQAVIINVGTKAVTTLALLSVLRHADVPALVIDCESGDGSFEHFTALQSRYDFELTSAPLRSHGDALDVLFRETTAAHLLLVDSDLEIIDPNIVGFLRSFLDDHDVYGAGFLNGPFWLSGQNMAELGLSGALFFERPWLPLVWFDVARVRSALDAGRSFVNVAVDNEYGVISVLARARGRVKPLRMLTRRGPAFLRKEVLGHRPRKVYFDTGARVHEYLRYERHLFFAGLPAPSTARFTHHFMGVTRRTLDPTDHHGFGGTLNDLDATVRSRLLTEYGERL